MLATRADATKALSFAMDHELDGGQGVGYVIELFRSAGISVDDASRD